MIKIMIVLTVIIFYLGNFITSVIPHQLDCRYINDDGEEKFLMTQPKMIFKELIQQGMIAAPQFKGIVYKSLDFSN